MKKTLTMITLLAGAVSGYSQGEILFSAYGTLKQAVYNTQASSAYSVTYGGFTVMETVGSSPTTLTTAESPAGTTAYTAGSALSGSGFSAELLVGPGGLATAGATNASGVGLTAYGGSASATAIPYGFFTGNARHLGFISAAATFTLPNQTYFAGGSTVSVAIAAWNTDGGVYPTFASAVAGTGQTGDAWGISPVVQMAGLPVAPAGGETIPTTLESFSLGSSVPEPSTIALGVMGASALLFRRRK
jgi:hypothetical protein